MSDLEVGRASNLKAQLASDHAKAELAVKMDSLRQEILARDRERQQEVGTRQKLEKELDDLRKMMAAKSSEDSKRQQADQSRDTEMSRLREQVSGLQKAQDEQRASAQQLASQLRVDVEGLRQSHMSAQRDVKLAQAALQEKEKALTQLQGDLNKADAAKRQVAAELVVVRDQMVTTENSLRSIKQARDVSEIGEIS